MPASKNAEESPNSSGSMSSEPRPSLDNVRIRELDGVERFLAKVKSLIRRRGLVRPHICEASSAVTMLSCCASPS